MPKSFTLTQISQLLDEKLQPIREEQQSMRQEQQSMRQEQQEQRRILKTNTKLLKSLKKDQGTMLAMLDKEQMVQSKRVTKIEQHLGITTGAS